MTNTAFYICGLPIPFSIGFSIPRYLLYDIDGIINRTPVSGTLTALLALVYFGIILALQSLLGGVINSSNSVTIVVSTLVIVALFQPLRSRIQLLIDRRFYRSKDDAACTLAAFSATLCNHLLEVVQEAMQPAHVPLWLARHGRDGKWPGEKLKEPNGGGRQISIAARAKAGRLHFLR